jgi:hypothetical protein
VPFLGLKKLVDNIDGAVKSIRETIPSVQKTIEDFGFGRTQCTAIERGSEPGRHGKQKKVFALR